MASPESPSSETIMESIQKKEGLRSPLEEKVDTELSIKPSTKDFALFPIPRYLRYDPERPFKFTIVATLIYAVIITFLTANLYYCQPLLVEMATTFSISYEQVAKIPVFVQAGYAVGLLLICPLGDTLKRRPLILTLVFITTCCTIALAVTTNYHAFLALNFLIGFSNLTSQILMPLVAEMAPPKRRAFAYSLLLTGLLFGILLARVIAGLIAQFINWRIVYYTAIGIQALILLTLYFILPDHPPKNPDLSYINTFWTMGKLAVTEPRVVQVLLINLGTSACFSYYWVTLTFLLNGTPYFYNTLQIGLFGLLGMTGVAAGPLSGYIVDRVHPWHAILFSTLLLLGFQAVQTAAGGLHISAVIISCLGLDFLQQIQGVGLVMSIFSVSTEAMSRLNTLFMISFYGGQMIGAAVGTKLFVRFGWRASAAFGMGLYIMQLLALLVRGPHCPRFSWFGYNGGIGRKSNVSDIGDKEHGEDPPEC